jgi:hypothetical protein
MYHVRKIRSFIGYYIFTAELITHNIFTAELITHKYSQLSL